MGWQILRKTTKWGMLILHLFFTLLLTVVCYGNEWSDSGNWMISVLTMFTIFLWVLQFVFFVFWLVAKPIFTLISLLAIVTHWQPMSAVFQWRVGTSFNQAKPRSSFRMMTWNVEHFAIRSFRTNPEIRSKMLELVRSYNPDIACFQEMVATEDKPKAINYLPVMQKQLGFKYAYYVYERVLDFDQDHHFGMVVFSKTPFIAQQKMGISKKGQNGLFQSVDFELLGDTFRVFNIHLQSLKFSKNNRAYIENPSLNEEEDLQESKNILKKLKIGFEKRKLQADSVRSAIDKSPHPVILCGDFNDLPNSYAYHKVKGGLVDAFTEAGSGIGHTYSGLFPTLRIDHVFIDPQLETVQYYTHQKKLSDHYPVIVDVRKRKLQE